MVSSLLLFAVCFLMVVGFTQGTKAEATRLLVACLRAWVGVGGVERAMACCPMALLAFETASMPFPIPTHTLGRVLGVGGQMHSMTTSMIVGSRLFSYSMALPLERSVGLLSGEHSDYLCKGFWRTVREN